MPATAHQVSVSAGRGCRIPKYIRTGGDARRGEGGGTRVRREPADQPCNSANAFDTDYSFWGDQGEDIRKKRFHYLGLAQ